MKTVAVLSY